MTGYYLFTQAEPNRFRPIAYSTNPEKIKAIKANKEQENPHADLLLLQEVKL